MNPYAVVATGGKQMRVEPQQIIEIERVRLGRSNQKKVVLEEVLAVRKGDSFAVGNPYVKGASVVCEYLGEAKGPKVTVFKIRRRKNYRRKKGHRQVVSRLQVKEIEFAEKTS